MITNVLEVYDFNELYNSSWGGAISTLKTIEEEEKEDDFLDLINDIISTYEKGLDRTKLNDFIWFDSDYIFESLAIEVEDND